jgi:hypothetical protein
MHTAADFTARMGKSANAAARLYFQPLSRLVRALTPLRAAVKSNADYASHQPRIAAPLPMPTSVQAWQAALEQVSDPASFALKVDAAEHWTHDMLRETEERKRGTAVEYRRLLERFDGMPIPQEAPPQALYGPTAASRLSRQTSWILAVFEFLVAFLVSTMALPGYAVELAALETIVFLFLARTAVAFALTPRGEEDRSFGRRTRLLTALVATPVLAILVAILALRIGAPRVSELLGYLWGYLLLGLLALIPFLFALLRTEADVLGWSDRISRQWRELSTAEAELRLLAKYVEVLRVGQQIRPGPSGAEGPHRAVRLED